jgi:hypothetical protein
MLWRGVGDKRRPPSRLSPVLRRAPDQGRDSRRVGPVGRDVAFTHERPRLTGDRLMIAIRKGERNDQGK